MVLVKILVPAVKKELPPEALITDHVRDMFKGAIKLSTFDF